MQLFDLRCSAWQAWPRNCHEIFFVQIVQIFLTVSWDSLLSGRMLEEWSRNLFTKVSFCSDGKVPREKVMQNGRCSHYWFFFIKYFSHIDILDKNSLWFTFFCWSKRGGAGGLDPLLGPTVIKSISPLAQLSLTFEKMKKHASEQAWSVFKCQQQQKCVKTRQPKAVLRVLRASCCLKENHLLWNSSEILRFSWASKKAFPPVSISFLVASQTQSWWNIWSNEWFGIEDIKFWFVTENTKVSLYYTTSKFTSCYMYIFT